MFKAFLMSPLLSRTSAAKPLSDTSSLVSRKKNVVRAMYHENPIYRPNHRSYNHTMITRNSFLFDVS